MTSIKRETILIIENDLNVARQIVNLCFAMGHEPLVARDGFTGLLLAKKVHPRLILSDVAVPGLDGFEIVRRIRQIRELDHTAIVAISPLVPGRAAANQNSFNDCVVTPIHSGRLEQVIKQCCAAINFDDRAYAI